MAIYQSPEAYRDFFLWLKENRYDFEVVKSGRAIKIKCSFGTYYYSNDIFSFTELGLMSRFKKEVKESNLYNDIMKKDKGYKFYHLRNSIEYNYLYRSTAQQMGNKKQDLVLGIDLDSAYTNSAFLLSVMSSQLREDLLALKKKWKEEKEESKNINQIIGGVLCSEKFISFYRNGKKVSIETKESEFTFLWWLISYFIDRSMRKTVSEMRRPVEDDGHLCSLAYYVDCAFLNVSYFPAEFISDMFRDMFSMQVGNVFSEVGIRTGFPVMNYRNQGFKWGAKGDMMILKRSDYSNNHICLDKSGEEKNYVFNSRCFE